MSEPMSVTSDVCLQAVLIPPQEARLRALCALGDAPLRADVTGWHKYALVAQDRVFLLARHAEWQPGLERELAAYDALNRVTGAPAPRLLGRWADPEVWPYPFGCVSRLPGIPFGAVEAGTSTERHADLLEELAARIAVWHATPLDALPNALRAAPVPEDASWGRRALRADQRRDVVDDLRTRLAAVGFDVPPTDDWVAPLAELADLTPVLVHGDVHEDQILVADGDSLRITGILDWETARVDHPAWDFNFGEWGYPLWDHQDHFRAFRARMWRAYGRVRGIPLPDYTCLHLFYALSDMAWRLDELAAGHQTRDEVLAFCAGRLASLKA